MPLRSALLALALVLAACDASAPDAELSTADLDDAAVVVASALATDAGGVLEDAAAAAGFAAATDGARLAGPDRPGCRGERTYDEAAALWTVVADCERGDPDGRFYAAFARTSTYRFLGADGTPQQRPAGAATLEYDVLSGTSEVRAPRGSHTLRSLAVDLTVAELGAELVTVDGTVRREAASALAGRRGERTVDYTLEAALDGVRGPRGVARRWRQAVDGTVSGTLRATITRTPAGGETTTVEVDEAFEVTFPAEASGDRVARIVLGGRTYRADVETGDVAGLSD